MLCFLEWLLLHPHRSQLYLYTAYQCLDCPSTSSWICLHFFSRTAPNMPISHSASASNLQTQPVATGLVNDAVPPTASSAGQNMAAWAVFDPLISGSTSTSTLGGSAAVISTAASLAGLSLGAGRTAAAQPLVSASSLPGRTVQAASPIGFPMMPE
ncbi:unnamed protein product [Protopolystoma xenopodis]|uniref:Uncharacterized protein n=1 Tax=Protopolystoma xenopodis TaxID=117903 RepID=A0A3S5BMY1_9PLAT|nr:unnamed protein product [Protopolystoma xenopodis]